MASATQTAPTTPPEVPAPTAAADRHRPGGSIVLFLSLGGLSFAVLQSMVAPALATIGRDLDVSTSSVSWVLTAYLLSAAVLTPVLGRLGDIAGKRKVLIVVLVLLLIGTVLAALAPNLTVLIVGRALQGAAGAVMPLSIGIVRDELPKERVSVTIGLLSAIFGIGAGVGIVAAGPIVENLSWHWLFWLPGVLVVIALAGAVFGMKESPVRKPGRLDLAGTAILSVALVSILLAVGEGQGWGWSSARTVGLLVLGALALVAFVLVELRVAEPLVDVRLFTIRGVWTAHAVALAFGFAMFGTFVLVPTLLQLPTAVGYGFGKDVTQAGFFLLPTVVMMVVAGPVAGMLVRRVGPRVPLLVGAVSVTAAFVLPAISHAHLWQVVVSGLLTGVGIGMALASCSNAIIESVPATQTGEAISANTVVRTIGSSIGTAVIAAIITSRATAQGLPGDDAFTVGFWACAGVGVLALAGALAAPRLHRRRQRDAAAAVAGVAGITGGADVAGVVEPSGEQPAAAPSQRSSSPLEVSGVVRTAGSVPRAGAVVTLADAAGGQVARTTTAADGAYRLPLSTGGSYLLIAAAPHVAPHAQLVTVGGSPVVRDVVLVGGSAITGCVLLARTGGAGTQAVADARVTLTDADGDVLASTTSDATGSYSFEGLPGGEYVLTAQAGRYQPCAHGAQVPDQGAIAFDLLMVAGAPVNGTVTAGPEGRPLPGATVTLVEAGGRLVEQTITGSDGSYTFLDVPDGHFSLTAGFEPVTQRLVVSDAQAIPERLHLGETGEDTSALVTVR